jgi:diamine N-acetyltransferase
MIQIRAAIKEDAKQLEQIANVIWREHYEPIIGLKQVEYMLDKFQSEKAISEQIEDGVGYFIVSKSDQPIGYFSIIEREKSLFISKFYLESNNRGQGIAHLMLSKVYQLALDSNISQLDLTVNKYNPAYNAYLKLGFENIDSVQVDIGGGYIMDDYVMIKKISSEQQNN